jgi:Holliday junction resolvase RusA-like endonuclease
MYAMAHGKIYKKAGVERYQTDVAWIVKATKPSGPPPAGMIRLRYRFFLDRDSDVDNLQKAITDAIATALGVNDRMFVADVACKHVGVKQPYVQVLIGSAEPCTCDI